MNCDSVIMKDKGDSGCGQCSLMGGPCSTHEWCEMITKI